MKVNNWMKIGIGVAVIALIFIIARNDDVRWVQSSDQQDKLRVAFERLAMAETLRVETDLKIKLPPRQDNSERPFNEVWVWIVGDARKADAQNYELTGEMHLEAKGRGNLLYTDGDVRILEDATMFRLEELPALLNPGTSLVDKWVKVPGGLVHTNDPTRVYETLRETSEAWKYQGEEKYDDEKVLVFNGSLPVEDKQKIIKNWQQSVSGNKALGVVARLLRNSEAVEVEVLVDKKNWEIKRVKAEFDQAVLELSFTDYDKSVEIERPEAKVELEPELFRKLFGAGELPQT
jgi:hypothetical protein